MDELDLTQTDDRELTDEEIGSVTDLLTQLIAVQQEQADHEEAAEAAKKKAFHLSSNVIPSRMDELNTPFFGMPDGRKIEVVDDFSSSITKKNKAAAHAWLRENGFGGIIKNVVSVAFAKGEDAQAEALVAQLQAQNLPVSQAETVAWQTLRAFIKEQKEKGTELPADLLSLFEYRRTEIS